MKKTLFLFFFFSVLLISCKKKDEVSPYIQITSPNENSNHDVLDTLAVVGSVSDNENLEYVKISLLNEDNITVATAVTLFPETNEYSLNREFIIDNILLESGDYNLLITASDGINESRKYIQISLNEAVTELTGILFVETPTSNSVEVKKIIPIAIGTDLSVQQVANFTGDFSAAVTSSVNQAFYIAGKETGQFHAIELLNNTEIWSIQTNPLSGAPYFNDVYEYNGKIYVSFYDGFIKEYNKSGAVMLSITTQNDKAKIYRDEDYIYSAHGNLWPMNLNLYFADNGEEYQSTMLDLEEVTGWGKRNDDNLLVFGNFVFAGTSQMMNYTVSENGFWIPHTMPAGKVLCTERIDDNTFIIGHETGVYKYTYNPNSLTDYLPGVVATSIKYEPLSNLLILSEGNSVKIYNYNNAGLLNTVSAASEIKSLSLLYNK